MGVALPKPVMTKLLERQGNDIFRIGSCCVNGYRESMEDAHIVELRKDWGFFGVFDGHVNDQCSIYLEGAWHKIMATDPVPMTDEKMKEIALQIDKEWLDEGREGGSTGTFFLATKKGDNVELQVGNVGDSRVLLCKKGVCVPMTEDHKPSNPEERQRIIDCGGRVENCRVDGSLAVSRAFGDRDYKQGNGDQLQQKVIALADVTHETVVFGSGDFAALCCDGVFESNFSNDEVIEFIKAELRTCSDLAIVASKVCEEAITRGSRDNISCVIVQFNNGSDYGALPEHLDVVPGPFNAPKNGAFRKVYNSMALKGNTTVDRLLEKRFDQLQKEDRADPALRDELDFFGEGPPASATGAARTRWFETLFSDLTSNRPDQSEQMQRIQLLQQQVGVPLPILLSLMNNGADV